MPLFKSRDRSVTPPVEEQQHTRKGSIFSRRRPEPSANGDNNSTRSGSTRSGNGGFFGSGKDSTIAGARQKVSIAEEREKAADQALVNARQAVTEAREHARKLELEAEEE
jgi:hypothetical protein